jgi:nucleoside-diphosphate-sugar epimerase
VTTDRVLVTGAVGLVSSAVVATLAEQGRRVVATDLDIPANRKRAQALTEHRGVQLRWADLTSPADVEALGAACQCDWSHPRCAAISVDARRIAGSPAVTPTRWRRLANDGASPARRSPPQTP